MRLLTSLNTRRLTMDWETYELMKAAVQEIPMTPEEYEVQIKFICEVLDL